MSRARSGVAVARAASARRSTWMLVAVSCAFGTAGCPVDERPLELRPGLVFLPGDEGGTGASPGAEAGQANVASTGGSDFGGGTTSTGGEAGGAASPTGGSGADTETGGTSTESGGSSGVTSGAGGSLGGTDGGGAQGGSGGHLTGGRCPDLDGDYVFDCEETLARNASFDGDASGWSTETNVLVSWESTDALDHSDSGSLGLENTFTNDMDAKLMVGAHQCIPITGGETYRLMVQVSTPSESPDTQGGFEIVAYDDKNCSNAQVDVGFSNLVSGADWQVAEKAYTAQAIAKSLLLRLVSVKPYRDAPNKVLFDNVLVRQIPD